MPSTVSQEWMDARRRPSLVGINFNPGNREPGGNATPYVHTSASETPKKMERKIGIITGISFYTATVVVQPTVIYSVSNSTL